jgi:hypothetical protein
MTSLLIPSASASGPEPATNARAVSSFTALTRRVHDLGLMRRMYGYYWIKLVGAVLILAAWVLAFIWIGDSWWQLVNAGVFAIIMAQLGFLGHDARRGPGVPVYGGAGRLVKLARLLGCSPDRC